MPLQFLPTPVCSAALCLIALQVGRSAFHTSSLPVIPAIQAGAAETGPRDGVILLAAHAAACTSTLLHPLLHSVLPAAAARVDFERARTASPPIPPLYQIDGMQTL
ncbi:hypothetical protein B0H14DRAFT_2712214 [Mycena olivaceomarginata]|nr:hypothetical protein B0H14DRAFT_2712214 [Mycena olivaceomarginata]